METVEHAMFFCEESDRLRDKRTTFALGMSARVPDVMLVSQAMVTTVLRRIVFNRETVCQTAKFVHQVFQIFEEMPLIWPDDYMPEIYSLKSGELVEGMGFVYPHSEHDHQTTLDIVCHDEHKKLAKNHEKYIYWGARDRDSGCARTKETPGWNGVNCDFAAFATTAAACRAHRLCPLQPRGLQNICLCTLATSKVQFTPPPSSRVPSIRRQRGYNVHGSAAAATERAVWGWKHVSGAWSTMLDDPRRESCQLSTAPPGVDANGAGRRHREDAKVDIDQQQPALRAHGLEPRIRRGFLRWNTREQMTAVLLGGLPDPRRPMSGRGQGRSIPPCSWAWRRSGAVEDVGDAGWQAG
ncbi:hypothetical protein C8R44DRAFT_939003 [Mycena epipterygia]|nr:hypothetical protein C8R44DRAFT_939003 [Mycena epipterygia]